ncbi:Mur ligase family protein [Gammaproteobacteria bacterium]|nr:Mur ligase family protein [Gammaproteobacteria bacterium]
MRVIILGVCGSLMSGVAILAKQLGFEVLGFDRIFADPAKQVLRSHRIDCFEIDSVITKILPTDCIIVANQMTSHMPFIKALVEMKLKLYSAPEWLGEFVLRSRRVVAVAGCHGKTTTTAMVASMLHDIGEDCGYLVAGTPKDLAAPAYLGTSAYFVIEADEYDSAFFDKRPKFLHYWPHYLILGAIEYDHADIYDDFSQMLAQYKLLFRLVSPQGAVVYSQLPEALGDALVASELKLVQTNQVLRPLSVPGKFNQDNAAKALSVGQLMGFKQELLLQALCRFSGVKRRCEVMFKGDVTLIDDHAHHPTALLATLKIFANQRVHLIYYPKTHTQRQDVHHIETKHALTSAHQSYILLPNLHTLKVSGYQQTGIVLGDEASILSQVMSNLQKDDVILICAPVALTELMQKIQKAVTEKYCHIV